MFIKIIKLPTIALLLVLFFLSIGATFLSAYIVVALSKFIDMLCGKEYRMSGSLLGKICRLVD